MSFNLSKRLLDFFGWEKGWLGLNYLVELKASTLVEFMNVFKNAVFVA